MKGEITFPLWLFLLLLALAILALIEHFFLPGVRWFVRRRVNRVVEELNNRLRLRIKPFKLTKRQVLIDRLTYDPEVLEAVERLTLEDGIPRDALIARVRGYAKEIVPAFNAYAYFRVGCWLAQKIARSIYRVRLGYIDEEGHAGVPPDSSVVFVMNHRSNFDYILIAYLVASRAALSYAVGEWARIWPLQTLIRAMGAYFIRRKSGDELYRTVLKRYVHMATQAGVVQAVYPEGGLSRDGYLLPPRLGLLSYMLRSFNPDGERDLIFIPVGINYDRVLEDRSLLRSVQAETPRRGILVVLFTTLRFLAHNLSLMIRGRWHRLGYVCVNFGSPISMREYVSEHDIDFRGLDKEDLFREVERLGEELMSKVGEIVSVTPVALVASLFLQNKGMRLSKLEIKAGAHTLMRDLESLGAHIYIPRSSQDYAVTVGLRMLTLRHIVDETDGLYLARDEEDDILRYYANSIAHLRSDPIEEKFQ
jgi:glycerol-3-phosphate O-acyltransferase